MRRGGPALAVAVCLLVGGCTATIGPDGSPALDASSSPGAPSETDAGGGLAGLPPACHLQQNGALPDPVCTPGATDPAVTQSNLSTTICLGGFTRRVRPPTSYTTPLKRDLMGRYGLTGPLSSYELDHLVPLEIGGAPRSVHNLWPEPNDVHPGTAEKDRLENRLHDQVCSGRVSLAAAQRVFAQNWLVAWQQYGR